MGEEVESSSIPRLSPRPWRLVVLVIMVLIGVAAIVGWSGLRFFYSGLVIRSCLQDARGLQPGAVVSSAGVEIGRVRVVRAQPDNHSCPALIQMFLSTPYELKIPSDSIVMTQTAGILGATYVDIDASAASGPPIVHGAELKSRSTEQVTAKQWLEMLEKITHKECGDGKEAKSRVER